MQRALLPIAPQFICNVLYLFFPRYIHDSFRIVVKAFAQRGDESSLEAYARHVRPANGDSEGLRARQRTPDARNSEIRVCSSHSIGRRLRASQGSTNNDRQQKKTPLGDISTSISDGRSGERCRVPEAEAKMRRSAPRLSATVIPCSVYCPHGTFALWRADLESDRKMSTPVGVRRNRSLLHQRPRPKSPHHRHREEHSVDAVEHPSVARENRARVLNSGAALD